MYRIIRYVVLIGYVGLVSNSISAANINITGAISKYHQGDFEVAMFQFQQIADQSEASQAARANFMLGKMYERGDGVLVDDQIAFSYYGKAADGGNADAVKRLEEFGGDESIVQDWYLESAWDGDVDAQYNLGYLFETGMGVQIDKSRAIQWYSEAAKKKHEDAQFRLGLMLISAEHENQDLESGKLWIKAAAENGNRVAASIVDRLFNGISDEQLVQAIRGIRTYDQSSVEPMLAVVSNAIQVQKASSARQMVQAGQPQNDLIRRAGRDPVEPDSTSVRAPVSFAEPESLPVKASLNSKSNSKEFQLEKPDSVVPDFAGTPDLFVETKFTGDAELDQFSEQRGNASQSWDPGSPFALLVAGVLLLCGYLLRNQKRNKQQYRMVPMRSVKAPGSNEEDLSALLERLMHNSAAVIEFETPVEEKEKESVIPFAKRQSETVIDRPIVNIEAHRKSDIKTRAVKLTHENFLPVSTADVVLRRHVSEPVMISVEDVSIATDYSHAVDDTATVLPQNVPLSQTMSEFSDLLEKESDADESDDMVIADSYYNIGIMFSRGDGIAQNLTLGTRWLQKAADKGHKQAIDELRVMRSFEEVPDYLMVSSGHG